MYDVRQSEHKQLNDDCSIHGQYCAENFARLSILFSSAPIPTSIPSCPKTTQSPIFFKHCHFFLPSPSRNFPIFSPPGDPPHYFMEQNQLFPEEMNLDTNILVLFCYNPHHIKNTGQGPGKIPPSFPALGSLRIVCSNKSQSNVTLSPSYVRMFICMSTSISIAVAICIIMSLS